MMKRTTIFSFATIYNGINLNQGRLIDVVFATGTNAEVQFGSGANFDLVGAIVTINNSSGNAVQFNSLVLEPIQTNGNNIFTAIPTDFTNATNAPTFAAFSNSVNTLPQPIAIPAGLRITSVNVTPSQTELTDLRVIVQIFCEYDI